MTAETQPVTREWNGLTIPAAGTYQLDPAHKRVAFVRAAHDGLQGPRRVHRCDRDHHHR